MNRTSRLVVLVAAGILVPGCTSSPLVPSTQSAAPTPSLDATQNLARVQVTRYAIYVVDGATGAYVSDAAVTDHIGGHHHHDNSWPPREGHRRGANWRYHYSLDCERNWLSDF